MLGIAPRVGMAIAPDIAFYLLMQTFKVFENAQRFEG